MSALAGQSYEFGPFRLTPEDHLLTRDGHAVTLTPKAFDVLVVLVSHAGHLVRKEELLHDVWSGTFVEEANVSYTVSLLRKALEEDGAGPHYIDTVPKVGYRFEAPVRTIEPDPTEARRDQEQPQGWRRWLAGRRLAAMVAGLGLALTTVIAWLVVRARPPAPGGAAAARAVVVIPLQTLSGADDEYVADGIADAMTTALAKLSGLLVISRNSAAPYKGRTVDPRTVGRDLPVSHVLGGTVQRSGERLRVSVQLADAATGQQVWAEQYDRDRTEIFALQDAIAASIVRAFRPGAAVRPPRAPPTGNPRAYDEYLRGRFQFHAERILNAPAAIERFERATTLDPRFGLAHAALATAYASRFFYRDTSRELEERAFVAIEKALAIDPNLAEAHLARANLLWTLPNGFPHEQAIKAFRHVLTLDPSLGDARTALARVLMHLGFQEEALVELRTAVRLDPSDTEAARRISHCYFYRHEYERVLAEFERIGWTGSWFRPNTLMHLGRVPEALQVARADVERSSAGSSPSVGLNVLNRSTYALVLAKAGERDLAIRILADLAPALKNENRYSHAHHTQYNAACAFALLGRKREALALLQTAADGGFPCYPFFRNEPSLAGLRGDPDFEAFMYRLEKRWQAHRVALMGS
jgi:TolB-like protein/DNA-binding winged helix-turn-helix (wHTH) protein